MQIDKLTILIEMKMLVGWDFVEMFVVLEEIHQCLAVFRMQTVDFLLGRTDILHYSVNDKWLIDQHCITKTSPKENTVTTHLMGAPTTDVIGLRKGRSPKDVNIPQPLNSGGQKPNMFFILCWNTTLFKTKLLLTWIFLSKDPRGLSICWKTSFSPKLYIGTRSALENSVCWS